MTATAGSLSRREKARGAAAAKDRRQKIVLAVGGVLLLGLLAFQGPKVLKQLHPGSAATPAAVPTHPASPSAPMGHARHVDSLARIARFAAKDPFVAQIGGLGEQTNPPLASGPAVRASHFVSKDPFVSQVSESAPASGSTPASTPSAGSESSSSASTGKSGYIVMLASVDKGDGRGQAASVATAARNSGIGNVRIVDSTDYGTLRSGFYAVFSGPYGTFAELQSALTAARAKGYISAYTRRLGK
jgi:hypothetical protein